MCPFCEISSLRCIAFSAIFNISKLVLCVCVVTRIRRDGRKREEESREKTPGRLARVVPYQKLKFHSAKPSGRYRDPLGEGLR